MRIAEHLTVLRGWRWQCVPARLNPNVYGYE